ncbi:putative cytochrome c oxidase subunit protein [Phaeoacremonium minimum UCRPA7]|uniref:Putative cytochrome c oxidase subunit protein n=1 Tax=Phaeoacremonium minimum (strain UCR-PA7) TaxID=1286976 RepID=R8BPU1_PHAM7|nr:putative cytochrome c oxidase subunit protein [Phaeoacremonium minimum UCRPA7]EOO01347.1 putative cytochrome c oxidase subunit protein [Phaeoacremonium minimum UCRPA7]
MRAAPRFASQLRSPAVRSALQRRLMSSPAAGSSTENAFVRERKAVKEHAASTTGAGVIPCLILAGANAYYLWNEHWDHWSHLPPLEERVEYPYQNIRVRNFPWGDGDKTLFWNKNVNYHNKDKAT